MSTTAKKLGLAGALTAMLTLLVSFCVAVPSTAEAATTLEANKTYTFTLSSTKSIDLNYKMPKSGYFKVQVTPTETDSSLYDWLNITTTNKTTYTKYNSSESISYGKGTWTSDLFSFKAGDILQTRITAAGTTFFSPSNYSFKVKVVQKSKKYFESESNNSAKKADKIKKLKTSYSGIIMSGDKDYWKFTASKKGTYKFYGVYTADDYGTIDATVKKGSKTLESAKLTSGKGWSTLSKVKLKKGQTITVKLSDSYNSGNDFYKLKVKKVK